MASGPDQGFAWVIALACFFINFIMAGLARTAGVLYVAIIDLYGVSREAATTPFSIRVCVRNMTGPLIGLLGQKYGIRIVTTIGALIAAIGSILCYFAPNVLWITIFWGVIHGLGFGLSTVLHMITINQYFHKYKASALGLGYSGDCFGTFAFPLIMDYLISTYDVRGTFLIIGGIILNSIPMALLLRKPSWLKDATKSKIKKDSAKKNIVKKQNECSSEDKVVNNQRCERNNKLLKSNSQIGMLDTVNEIENFEREKSDDTKLDENASDHTQFITFGYDMKGQFNKAFVSSETDLTALNKDNVSRCSSNLSLQKSSVDLERKKMCTPLCSNNSFSPSTSKSCLTSDFRSSNSSLCDSKHFKKSDDLRVCPEIKLNKSVTDLNQKNRSLSDANSLLRLKAALHVNVIEDRRESMPPGFEKGKFIKQQSVNSAYESEDTEIARADATGTPRKRRTSSFVGQVAHEIVNRMRTASFASSVCQDGFVAPIPQEPESDSEQEQECELKSIVEHRNHDIDNCTQRDVILSADKMMGDYFKEIPTESENVPDKNVQPPSIYKLLLRTNLKPMFILISISMAVYAFLFVSVLTIIIDYAADLGIFKDQGKYLVIGFSVADLIGRLSFGQVIDRDLMKMKNYAGVTMFLTGALVAVIPLNTSFNYMMVCMCMYGLFQGGTAIMFPILINKYMDRNSESVAMGCVNFYGGFLMLLMAPMIGYFRDNTGSYNYVFYIIGGVVAVVGIVWQFEPMIIKFQNRKLREKYIMKGMSLTSVQQ